MTPLQGKKILFFAPPFFGYDIAIKNKLEEFGAEVDLYDERPSATTFWKAVIRMNARLAQKRIDRYFDHIITTKSGKKYDYLFVIKGEVFSAEIVNRLKAAFPEGRTVLYLWDSIKNYELIQRSLCLFDDAFTFDREDANNFSQLSFRPLFYVDQYAADSEKSADALYDLLFIGTAHSDRWPFIKAIKKQADALGLSTFLYIYFQSSFVFTFRKIFDRKNVGTLRINDVRFNAIARDSVIDKVKRSKVIIDIQHPKQTGLTMRSLEVFGAGRKLITTNTAIVEYDFYNPQNVMVVDRENPIMAKEFFETYSVKPDKHIQWKYSLTGWISEIFGLSNYER